MPNPLFNAMMGGAGKNHTQPQQVTMQDAMSQLQGDPAGMVRQAGFNIPDNLMGNPQAMVMHLIRSGQVGGPMMRMIQPMIGRMMGGK